MFTKAKIILLSFLIIILWSPSLFAVTYNAADDFSATTNPNGVWSYGYQDTLGGTLNLYQNTAIFSGLSVWYAGITNLGHTLDYDPVILHNGTGSDYDNGQILWKAGQLSLHPGVVTGPFNVHPYSVLRWTVPSDGFYTIDASFIGLDRHDVSGTTTDIHVLMNGSSLFDDYVLGFGSASKQTFSSSVSLMAGDRIDFAVGPATDKGPLYDYEFDTTGVAVTISAVPEPATMLLLGLGLMGLAGVRRKIKS